MQTGLNALTRLRAALAMRDAKSEARIDAGDVCAAWGNQAWTQERAEQRAPGQARGDAGPPNTVKQLALLDHPAAAASALCPREEQERSSSSTGWPWLADTRSHGGD